MGTQLCEGAKKHWFAQFQRLNSMTCGLCLSKGTIPFNPRKGGKKCLAHGVGEFIYIDLSFFPSHRCLWKRLTSPHFSAFQVQVFIFCSFNVVFFPKSRHPAFILAQRASHNDIRSWLIVFQKHWGCELTARFPSIQFLPCVCRRSFLYICVSMLSLHTILQKNLLGGKKKWWKRSPFCCGTQILSCSNWSLLSTACLNSGICWGLDAWSQME